MFNDKSSEGTTYVYLKRYVKIHPTAMLASDAHFEIMKIENGPVRSERRTDGAVTVDSSTNVRPCDQVRSGPA